MDDQTGVLFAIKFKAQSRALIAQCISEDTVGVAQLVEVMPSRNLARDNWHGKKQGSKTTDLMGKETQTFSPTVSFQHATLVAKT